MAIFKYRTRIAVSGHNQIKLLNKFSASGVRVYDVDKASPSEMSVNVRTKDIDKAIAIMQDLCYNYTVGEKRRFWTGILKRIWVPITIVCLTATVFASNLFVWGININGTSGATLVSVQNLVSDYGLHTFSYKPQSLSDLRLRILQLDGISAAAVTLDGNVLNINVIETTDTLPVETGGEVVSSYDAVVTRIVTESGSAIVKRGEVVRRGQTLIHGTLTATADGSVIAEAPVKGRVYGNVTFSYRKFLSDGIEWAKTGNTQTSTSLSIFGLTWQGAQCDYQYYTSRTTHSKYFCFGLTQTVYEEVAAESVSADTDEFIRGKQTELESLYSTTFDAKYIVEEIGGISTLKLYMTAEICIGQS